MTNKEAVIAEVQLPNYSDNAVEKALIDLEIDGAQEYSSDYATDVAKAAIKVLKTMLSTKSISEGGFQIQLAVQDRIADLQNEYGLIPNTTGPSVRGVSVW